MDAIAVINAGSSSIKFAVYDTRSKLLQRMLAGSIRDLGASPRFIANNGAGDVLETKAWEEGASLSHEDAMAFLLETLPALMQGHRVCAVGHRVVHGGERYTSPVRVDADILRELETLIPLAPLHQPHNLALIRTLLETEPGLPQIACFDTAFHHTMSPVERAFALPRDITEHGVRRYGFHGLSYEYIASVMVLRDPALSARVVVLHLGNGASMCAMQGGSSVATTMGFTALDGLPMGTRCGSLDPGVVLYLMAELQMNDRQIQELLYHRSGLLGVSGISSDMRTLEASDAPGAKEAIDLFVHSIKRHLGALAATLGGLDGIVFTAGIGENSALVRERVCRDAAWLGIELDDAANRTGASRITTASSAVSAWIIPTDEEAVIAKHTQRMITDT
ncbi:acetate/propionate family kinase [Thermomonas sp.]|uniref:acetate/propionate family kinase n=1 Tax=Thermomonas sp. TaxID=1971895 RepID=UPI0024878C17|nr:acetate/propionate family kinase [Thermomonas sp.]MDI1253394.1 acetate/propionate family kinase [Thermomonas sp.]